MQSAALGRSISRLYTIMLASSHIVRPLLLLSCATVRVPQRQAVAMAADGPSTKELRRVLSGRGVDTAGIFERSELLSLLDASTPSPPVQRLPSIEGMESQSLMQELEERGVDFDVLAPDTVLAAQLRAARAQQGSAGAPASGTSRSSSRPPIVTAPPASSSGRAVSQPSSRGASRDDAKAWRPTRGASPHRDLRPLVTEAFDEVVHRVGPLASDAIEQATPVVSGVVDRVGPLVSDAVDNIIPVASKAANAAGTKASEATAHIATSKAGQRARGLLKNLRPHLPPKPVLLLLCASALRFGLVRTALAAVAVKLALECTRDAYAWARRRRGASRRGPGGVTNEQGLTRD